MDLATAAQPGHLLAVDHGLRPLIGSLGGLSTATAIYATPEDFVEAGFSPELRARIGRAAEEAMRLGALRDAFESRVLAQIDDVRINGGAARRSPSISSLGIDGADGGLLLNALDLEGVATSGGSACASGSSAASHVISALFGPDDTKATVRFSMGRSSSEADVSRAVAVLAEVVGRVRGLEEVS